jgi:hypothetical protein
MVTIDLAGTIIDCRKMVAIQAEHSANDGLLCEVEQNQFRRQGDSPKAARHSRNLPTLG